MTDSFGFPPRQRPGYRGRIGIIQPAPGVMIEHEWPHWLPADILFPVGRIRLTAPTREGYRTAADAALAMARDLATAGADVIAYACTVGSLCDGARAEAALIERLAAASGKPVLGLAETSVAALRQVGAQRLAIMTPYSAETNGWVSDYISAAGFKVAGLVPTPVDIFTVGDIHPREVAAIAIAGMRGLPDADALWIPCTAIQTMAAIADIEAATCLPVVSGTQALMWQALRQLGISDAIVGAGRLFGSR